MTAIRLQKTLKGNILDIGGGGEGIIGRVYGASVTAIDNRQEELDEAPENCTKLCMDARSLRFADASFAHVTFFFSLLYMDAATQEQAIAEAARVLKPGGSMTIWDAAVVSAYPEAFLVELDIDAGGTHVHTTYGVVKPDGAQNADLFSGICARAGLRLCAREESGETFKLIFTK